MDRGLVIRIQCWQCGYSIQGHPTSQINYDYFLPVNSFTHLESCYHPLIIMHHHDSEVIVLLFVECSSDDERRQYYIMSYACVMVVELECIGLSQCHALTSLHDFLYAWLYTEILAIGGWISVAGSGTG